MNSTALLQCHEKLGAKIVPFAGYKMPVQYADGVKIEHQTVREAVGVFDVSHMGEVFISGDKALDFLQYITSNDVSKLNPGKVQYTCLPNADGGIVDDFLLYMIAKNNYLLVVNASNMEKDLAWINKHNTFGCKVDNQSDNYSLLAVQGPKSIELLQELTSEDLSEIDQLQKELEKLNQNVNPNNIKNVATNQELEETQYSNQTPIDKQKAQQEANENIKKFEAEQKRIASADNPTLNDNQTTEDQIDPNLFKKDEENENASYGSNIVATASYYVPNRNSLFKKIPSYKCKNEGVVRVTIKVGRNGKVIQFEIDESITNTSNNCLRQQALEYASKWRFTQDFNDEIKKQGWIEFNYLAQ